MKEDFKLDEAAINRIVAAATAPPEATVIVSYQGLDELEKRVATKGDIAGLIDEIDEMKICLARLGYGFGFVIVSAMVIMKYLPA